MVGYKKRQNYLMYGAPDIREDDIDEVVNTLRSGWIGSGPRVAAFEGAFLKYKEAGFASAVGSCTAGLHLSLLVAKLASGDEVITTAMTFCATVNAIIHSGATPVIVDIDPRTGNICPDAVIKAITPKTKALVCVHYGGYPCEMDRLISIAKDNNLFLIEDCAHAIETKFNGQPVGTFGDFGCFSFYVTKNVVTAEGGMVIGNDKTLIERIRVLALHGMSKDAWKRYSDQG